MKVSEVFAMGGGGGHEYDHDCHYGCGYGGYSGYYPDFGRWSYHYYNGHDYGSHGGYGYSHSHGLLGILG